LSGDGGDVRAVVKQLARQYHAANLLLDGGGKSGFDLHAKSQIVFNALNNRPSGPPVERFASPSGDFEIFE